MGWVEMSVVVKTDARSRRLRVRVFFAVVAVCVLGVSPAAWSFEVITTPRPAIDEAVAVMRAPEAAPAGDSCLYILRNAQEREGLSERERYYRQSAGSAAAVGLVFGVRFALGPSEVNKAQRRVPEQAAAFRVWEPRESTGSAQALAIADYRACRNEQALRALTD